MKITLVILAVVTAKVHSQIECHPELPSWHPHPSSCSHWILCFWENQLVRSCAPTLHYNRNTTQCMIPALAGCTLEDGIPFCEVPDDQLDPIFHPNVNDCQRYFMCHNGIAIARECASGLYWDINNDWCTFPDQVTCHPNAPNPIPPSTSTTTTTSTTTELPTTTKNPDSFDCPLFYGTYYYPHTVDCSRYFRCTNGIAYLHTCHPGSLFDYLLLTCVPASKANCVDGSTPPARYF